MFSPQEIGFGVATLLVFLSLSLLKTQIPALRLISKLKIMVTGFVFLLFDAAVLYGLLYYFNGTPG